MSMKENLLAIKEKLNALKATKGMNESQLKIFKQFNELLKSNNVESIINAKSILNNDPNWQLIKTGEVMDGVREEDLERSYEFYAPAINQGIIVFINGDASYASIRAFTELELKAIVIRQFQEKLLELTNYEDIKNAKTTLMNNPDWKLLYEQQSTKIDLNEIYEFYSEAISGGITININNETKTASIKNTPFLRLKELLLEDEELKR